MVVTAKLKKAKKEGKKDFGGLIITYHADYLLTEKGRGQNLKISFPLDVNSP